MSTPVIDRPKLDVPPITDMPPLNVIKCRCDQSCVLSGACPMEATDDDMLCDPCRKAIELIAQYKSGVFGSGMGSLSYLMKRDGLKHCHACDPEFNGKDDNAPS